MDSRDIVAVYIYIYIIPASSYNGLVEGITTLTTPRLARPWGRVGMSVMWKMHILDKLLYCATCFAVI